MSHITKNEIETLRNAAQIRPWVDGKLEEIGSTSEGKRAVRFHEGLTKELMEEALPLGIFCEHHFKNSRCVEIRHVVGNQNYDAEVNDKRLRKSPIQYIEITQAHEGEDAYLRMRQIEKEGHANALGNVTKTGTKNSGITIEIENEAVEHSVIVRNELQRISEAAIRKSKKEYPPNTGLIIVCDDYIAFRESDDVERLKEYMSDNVLKHLDNFRMVFVIGWSSKTYLEFDQNAI